MPLNPTTTEQWMPQCLYCPECNELISRLDITYRADVYGRAYGNAWIEPSHPGYEVSEDDTNYDNSEFVCNSCDCDITNEIHGASRIYGWALNQLDTNRRVAIEARARKIIEFLNNAAENELFNLTMWQEYYIVGSIRFTTENHRWGLVKDVFNPDHLQLINQGCNGSPINLSNRELFEFDPNNIAQTLFNKIYVGLTPLVDVDGYNASDYSPEQRLAIITEILASDITAPIIASVTSTDVPRQAATQERNDDPLNSSVINFNHHRRWQSTQIHSFFECESCKHAFEASNELDEICCPRCHAVIQNEM